MKLVNSLFLIIMIPGALNSQDIAFYADVMINADRAEHREYAADQFEQLFGEELSEKKFRNSTYSELPWISIQYPEDSLFRIITWQVDLGDNKYAYNGYLQTSENRLYKIAGPRGRNSHDNNEEIDFTNWKGGLIYKVLTIPEFENKYFVLTFRVLDQFTKSKTLEPLTFEEDRVFLGKKNQFAHPSDTKTQQSRLALLYSIDANASISYDPESRRIVYDNLVMMPGRIPGQGPTMVPDGSYKAFENSTNGSWTYIDKLYSQWNQGPLDRERKSKLDNELFKKKGKN